MLVEALQSKFGDTSDHGQGGLEAGGFCVRAAFGQKTLWRPVDRAWCAGSAFRLIIFSPASDNRSNITLTLQTKETKSRSDLKAVYLQHKAIV